MAMNLDPNDPITVAIFAKAPIPGFAKTRLIPCLGAEGAARLQSRLISRTVAIALEAAIGPVCLWCAPDAGHAEFEELARKHPVRLRDQATGNLGERMHAAFIVEAALTPVLLIGVDCPPLIPAHLRLCAQHLRSEDAVFLPAEDGGYVLVGLRRPDTRLFEGVVWGGAKVMEVTRHRLIERNMAWSEPETLWDLDRPEDLARWEALSDDIT